MKRPLLTWLVFAACTLTGLGVLGWFSAEMLRLERGAAQAREIAAREENVRLALWRMDSALASIHGLESARPVDDYEPFVRPPTTYSVDLRQNAPDGVLLPSPLLGFTPPFVRLHLQVRQDGAITSPQAPEGAARLAALQAAVPAGLIESASARLAAFRRTTEARALIASTEPSALQFASESDDARRKEAALAAVRENESAELRSAEPTPAVAPVAIVAP
ncbi:MAG: hypothetical protein IAE82_01665, partial [Opitutaceae bacterium]|nr:hypothetical protein [Opitutaceae bacterium]